MGGGTLNSIELRGRKSSVHNNQMTNVSNYDQLQLNDYYSQLAPELAQQPTRIHAVPERQYELQNLIALALKFSIEQNLLELACGIGFWTEKLAKSARAILAIDICESTLRLAEQRVISNCVRFARADALNLSIENTGITAVFSGFFLSHLRRNALKGFFSQIDSQLDNGVRVLFFENTFPRSCMRRYRCIDVESNTFEFRCLGNGDEHLILKNDFTDSELMAALSPRASKVRVERGIYYWSLSYEID